MADNSNTEIPAGNQTAWDSLMDLFLAAEKVAEGYENNEFKPLWQDLIKIWPSYPGGCQHERAAIERWSDESGYNKVSDRLTALVDQRCVREDALMNYPAPGLEALQWKLDKIFETENDSDFIPAWSRGYVKQTIADYRRLLKEVG